MNKKRSLAHIFESIAVEHNITIAEVRWEMEEAIRAGFNSLDPKVKAQWAKIPRKGEIPTPEELMIYIARQAKQNDTGAIFRRYLS